MHPALTEEGFEGAREACHAEGARHWEPRSKAGWDSLTQMEFSTLARANFPGTDRHLVYATGLRLNTEKGVVRVLYSDGREVAENFQADVLHWQPGHPVAGLECVGLRERILVSLPCDGFNNGSSK